MVLCREFAGLICARVGPFPVSLCSLSVLMMDWRCMCETHTHTHSGICHLFVSTFIYFPRFFYTLQFVWEKWGDAHTGCLSSVCVVCVRRGWGMFFLGGERSNPMKAVFPLLWTTFFPLTTFIYGHFVCYKFEEEAAGTNTCLVMFNTSPVCVYVSLWISCKRKLI